MSSELIIRATQKGSQVALLEEKQLVELHEEKYEDKFNVGDVYLGEVKKIVAGLNAAFIDIGGAKDAFLHYLDLGPYFYTLQAYLTHIRKKKVVPSIADIVTEQALTKDGKISDVLKKGDEVLVRIEKVPMATKGARVSCKFAFAGRYLILSPFSDHITISKRIEESEERNRLLRLVQSIKPTYFGVIIRTAGKGVASSHLVQDLQKHIKNWDAGMQKLLEAKIRQKIIGEIHLPQLLLRDLLSDSIENITTNDSVIYQSLKAHIQEIKPEKEKIIQLYEGKYDIFELFKVQNQLRSSLARYVRLAGGGTLVIDQTEALHVIDVNSGKNTKESDQEENALQVNKNAVEEIARQIRLRDLGGIIIIDFIDMRALEHKKIIFDEMKKSMSKDRSKHNLLPITKIGLLQMTRHRVRPALKIDTSEKCPTCQGTGKTSHIMGLSELIEKHITYLFTEEKKKSLTIHLHPYLYAYFTKGILSRQRRLRWHYKKPIQFIENQNLAITAFKFIDELQEDIELN